MSEVLRQVTTLEEGAAAASGRPCSVGTRPATGRLLLVHTYRARPAASATCTLRCSSGGGTGLKSRAVMPRRRQRA